MKAEMNSMLPALAALLVAGCGAFSDWKTHKIYNKLTGTAMIAGFCGNLLLGGWPGLSDSLLGFGMGLLSLVLWLSGMLKAGDIKLYLAIGALAGWRFCAFTEIASILIGGVAAACFLVVRREGGAALRRLRAYGLQLFYTRQLKPYQPEEDSAYFSFGCCILAGALMAFWQLYVR